MKKFFAGILVLSMCAGLVGCGSGGAASNGDPPLSATSPDPESISDTETDGELKTITIGALTAELPNDWRGEETGETTHTFAAPKIDDSVSVMVVSIVDGFSDTGGLKNTQNILINAMSSPWEDYSPVETTETVISEYYTIMHTFNMTKDGAPLQGKMVAIDNGQNIYSITLISADEDSQEIRRTQFENFLKTIKVDSSKAVISNEKPQDEAANKTFIQESANSLVPDRYKGKAYTCDVLTKTDGGGYILSLQLDIGTQTANAVDTGFAKILKDSLAELNGVEEVQISLISNSQLVDLEEESSSPDDNELVLTKEKLFEFSGYVGRMEFEEFCKKLKKEDATSDAIQKMLELSSEAAKLKEKLTIETDEVEGNTLYYYGNIKKLTEDVRFSTVIDNGDMRCKVGFYNSDWLFFDRVVIKPDNADKIETSYKGYDVETDVVDGGIREWAPIEFYGDEIKDLSKAKSAVIRFMNSKKDELLDFDLTKKELDAFKYISRIEAIKDEINDILYNRDRD